jgi:hypothetical protein
MNYAAGDIIVEHGVEYRVEMWSVTDLLQKITLSSDFDGGWMTIEFDGTPSTWAYIIASKAGDHHTPILAQKILDEGFTDPICVWRSELGAYGLGNGHHRLVCAILLGLDEIPVIISDTENYYPDASDGEDVWQTDPEFADRLYKIYNKAYQKLRKQEDKALAEELLMR